jgi:hypothetical protein
MSYLRNSPQTDRDTAGAPSSLSHLIILLKTRLGGYSATTDRDLA